jgi:hypothetical protein
VAGGWVEIDVIGIFGGSSGRFDIIFLFIVVCSHVLDHAQEGSRVVVLPARTTPHLPRTAAARGCTFILARYRTITTYRQ